MSLLFKSKRTSQPQGLAEIDWANPLTKNITALLPLNGNRRELVSGKQITTGAGGSFQATPKGLSLRGTGFAAGASIPIDLSAHNTITVSFWMYWDAYANGYNMAMEYSADGGANDGFYISPNASTGLLEVSASGSVCNARWSRPSVGWHHYQVVINRPSGGVAGLKLWVDGNPQTQLSGGGAGSTSHFVNSSLFLLCRNNSTLFGAGNLQNVVIRAGYIGTDADAKSEYQEPWQLFRPQSRSLWLPSTVSAGTTDALTAQSISTGAPTITQGAIGQTHVLTGQALATTAPTITTAAIGQIHALTGQTVSTDAPTITAPALTAASNVDNLIAQALSTGQITITQATLAQHHVLTAQAISTGAPTVSQPTLTAAANVDSLAAQDIATGAPTVSSPSIGQAHGLTAGAIACGPATISTPGLGQIHVLLGHGVVPGAPTVAMPVLGEPGAYTPSIYLATSPAMSYASTSPAQSYTATVPAQNYST